MKTKLSEMWQEYEERCLSAVPKDSVQYQETQRAFMAGAIGMFHNMQYISGRFAEDKALEKLNEIEIEANDWITSIIVTTPRKEHGNPE